MYNINSRNQGTYKIDLDSVYENSSTLMRFKCVTKINCLGCHACKSEKFPLAPHIAEESGSLPCLHGQICGKEFIATASQMLNKYNSKQYYRHNTFHKWYTNIGIVNTIRLFEMLYDSKFSDVVDNRYVRFTGYNKAHAVAYIHGKDVAVNFRDKSEKSLMYTKKYCADKGILLLTFPDSMENIIDIVKTLVHMMHGPHIQNPPWANLLQQSSISQQRNHTIKYISDIIIQKFRENTKLGNYYGNYATLSIVKN
jgi:hypothetical protein